MVRSTFQACSIEGRRRSVREPRIAIPWCVRIARRRRRVPRDCLRLRPVVGGGGRWVRVAPLRRDCRRRVIACQVIDRALACARVIVFFWVRSCLYVKLDSVHSCTETVFIFQEILRAKSDFGALM